MDKQHMDKYIKNLEKMNSDLDTENMKISKDNDRISNRIKQLEGANEDLSKCLELLLEKYPNDETITKPINNTLKSVTSKLIKQDY